jgi:hypothetical protein
MRKTSATLSKILENLDKKVVDNASSIKAVTTQFEKNVFKKPIVFKVGEYEVIVEAKGDKEFPDLYLSCTCNYWKYQGSEYHAINNEYLHGKTKGTATKPDKKDPDGTHKVCKHVYVVLRDYFGANL